LILPSASNNIMLPGVVVEVVEAGGTLVLAEGNIAMAGIGVGTAMGACGAAHQGGSMCGTTLAIHVYGRRGKQPVPGVVALDLVVSIKQHHVAWG
jgi:hypothetical protein